MGQLQKPCGEDSRLEIHDVGDPRMDARREMRLNLVGNRMSDKARC